MRKPKVIAIIGQTATGKSSLSVELAKHWNGEIISADSRQVYTGLNLGTGKISKREMRGVTHHLLDVANPKKTFSVSDFIHKATEAIHTIHSREKIPFVVGGTGFYVDALLSGISIPEVKPNESLRAKLNGQSAHQLFLILKKIDPIRAKNIDPHNKVRLIRAIEIAKAIGATPKAKETHPFNVLYIGITLDEEILKKKIHKRLAERIHKGMIREAKQLHEKGLSWKRMESLGLEYRYLAYYLQGKISKSEMIISLEKEIWKYAKRQKTWFKRNKKIHWIIPSDVKTSNKLIYKFIDKKQNT